MIHRQNWLDVRHYLHHLDRVRQNDPETVKRARAHLRHLLEWADETPLPKSRHIDPTFPTYLTTARADGKDKRLAPASIIKGLAFVRQYYSFARQEWPLRYRPISESWVATLQPSREIRSSLTAQLPVEQLYTIEDVRKIAAVSTETLREERGKVAVCMLFLSGMRADALASLPVSCVHLAERSIQQFPLLGVRTKGRKAAITYLLDISDLLDVVAAWDARVQALPPSALWYSTLTTDGMSLTATTQAYVGRNATIERDVRRICERAGIEYLSPHKLRHGHVVYALRNAQNMEDLKAISQNVMHSSVTITDGRYGNLLRNDVRNVITSLGTKQTEQAELLRLLDELKRQLLAG